MEKHDLPDDLSSLERRLAAWRPSPEALDADRMLYAAGAASTRPGPFRLVWPAAAACLAVLASVLGLGLADERAGRLALLRERDARPADPAPAPPAAPPPPQAHPTGPPPPASYLAARPALEGDDLDAWRTPADASPAPSPSPLPSPPPILRAWSPGTRLEP